VGIVPQEVDEGGRIALTYSVVTGIKRTKQWDERGILCIIQVEIMYRLIHLIEHHAAASAVLYSWI
jgi:hypothetical protein